ncbi:MAG TPA: TetR/AcrR family transcriptional regulator [Tepidiformaceae bacterium]|nr:TetR/AcrR family transcriptional regulator [Thermoflexaceae bacterium]HMS57401.1 TetR/AcrR family transcriptional regulator [Tepidiformaceae bacterium]
MGALSTGTDLREAEVRERIFQSALRHFSQKGFAATSLREISEDALTTKPMIYYYFGSKEGLYGSIVREILEEMASAIRSHVNPDCSAADQVLAYCERYVEHFLAKEEIIALVLREVFGLGGAPMATFSQALGEQVRQPLDEILRAGMDRGEFRRDHVFDCATALTGILNMFILAHVFGGAAIERDAPLRQVRHFVTGLGAAG